MSKIHIIWRLGIYWCHYWGKSSIELRFTWISRFLSCTSWVWTNVTYFEPFLFSMKRLNDRLRKTTPINKQKSALIFPFPILKTKSRIKNWKGFYFFLPQILDSQASLSESEHSALQPSSFSFSPSSLNLGSGRRLVEKVLQGTSENSEKGCTCGSGFINSSVVHISIGIIYFISSTHDGWLHQTSKTLLDSRATYRHFEDRQSYT